MGADDHHRQWYQLPGCGHRSAVESDERGTGPAIAIEPAADGATGTHGLTSQIEASNEASAPRHLSAAPVDGGLHGQFGGGAGKSGAGEGAGEGWGGRPVVSTGRRSAAGHPARALTYIARADAPNFRAPLPPPPSPPPPSLSPTSLPPVFASAMPPSRVIASFINDPVLKAEGHLYVPRLLQQLLSA